MAKLALCIKRQDLMDLNRILQYPPLQGGMVATVPEETLRLKTSLEDRATCETDPGFLQLLPYVVLQREDTKAVFVYCRGKGGEEARLHGNLSIGLGGHVDTDVSAGPEDIDSSPQDILFKHLMNDALRELEEEVGLKGSLPGDDNYLPMFWDNEVIYDDTNPVGQVHLGLFIKALISDDSRLGSAEVGVIEGSQWLTWTELKEPAVYDRLENWSKLIVDYAFANQMEEQLL